MSLLQTNFAYHRQVSQSCTMNWIINIYKRSHDIKFTGKLIPQKHKHINTQMTYTHKYVMFLIISQLFTVHQTKYKVVKL